MNAPVALLTAPIAGEVQSILVKLGESVKRGDPLARITNDRIDRSTAIQLQGKVSDLRERAMAAERKRLSNTAYLAKLDSIIEDRTAQMTQIVRSQIDELRAKIASAMASGEEKRVLMDRQTNMVARNVVSFDMVKSTSQAYAAAVHEKEAAEAKMVQKQAQLAGLLKGIYGGEELNSLAEAAQRRLAITYDTERLQIEEKELRASVVEQQQLLDRENIRLGRLSQTDLVAPADGVVYNISAVLGRHVSPGDSLGALVDCDRRFVVGIFSYRQGQNLLVGSRVAIGGVGDSRRGQVIEVLPKTSDTMDATYAVPFPQTERRELYVRVQLDSDAQAAPVSAKSNGETCSVGRWVTVTREAGWVPSTSVFWRTLQEYSADAASTAAVVFSRSFTDLRVALAGLIDNKDHGQVEGPARAVREDAPKASAYDGPAPTEPVREGPQATADVPSKVVASDGGASLRPAPPPLPALVPLPPVRPKVLGQSRQFEARIASAKLEDTPNTRNQRTAP